MTHEAASQFEISEEPSFSLDILRSLRTEVDALLGFLLSESKTERAENDAPIRGRDGCCQPPPAQIRTSPIRAYGSYLEYLTAKRCCGHG